MCDVAPRSAEPTGSPQRAATTVALWGAALAASTSADRVLDAVADTGVNSGIRAGNPEAARLAGLPGPGEATAPIVELLPLLRDGGPAALVLPVAGDLRGLPVSGDLTAVALEVGVALVLPAVDLAIVPVGRQWHAYPAVPPHPAMPARDVRLILDEAVRDATQAMLRADVGAASGSPRELVRRRMIAEEVAVPEGTPDAVSSLLARTISLEALLSVAAGHGTGAITHHQLAAVDSALAPLHAAAREARRTAVALATAALHPAHAGKAPAALRTTPRSAR